MHITAKQVENAFKDNCYLATNLSLRFEIEASSASPWNPSQQYRQKKICIIILLDIPVEFLQQNNRKIS